MAEMKATPRPWRIGDGFTTAIFSGDRWIATTWEANARLIVQAVNSHDALVDALEAASDELEHVIRAHGLNIDPDVLEQVYAALALAKQEAQ